MARPSTYLALVALLSGAAFAQSTGATPKFEAADVRASPHTSMPTSFKAVEAGAETALSRGPARIRRRTRPAPSRSWMPCPSNSD